MWHIYITYIFMRKPIVGARFMCVGLRNPSRPPTARQAKLHLELQPAHDAFASNGPGRMLNVHVLDATQLGTRPITAGVVEA